jgi:hypothetical protein
MSLKTRKHYKMKIITMNMFCQKFCKLIQISKSIDSLLKKFGAGFYPYFEQALLPGLEMMLVCDFKGRLTKKPCFAHGRLKCSAAL